MKKILLVLMVAPLLWSCSKDSNNNNSGGNSMSAKVNGSAWTADLSVQGNKSTGSPVVLTLAGTGSGSQINITVSDYSGPGTYSTSNGLNAIYTNTSTLAVYTANMAMGSGSVVVSSETNGLVQGTFSFTGAQATGGTGSASITEGTFRIQL